MATDEELLAELKRIARLLTVLVTREMSQKDQIQLLSSAGFGPREIAALIGTTPNTVSVTLSNIRRGATKKKSRQRTPA